MGQFTLFLIVMLIVCVSMVWFFAPLIFGLTSSFEEFIKLYPNKYKQWIVIIMHGPMCIIAFGFMWFKYNLFNNIKLILDIKCWLKK